MKTAFVIRHSNRDSVTNPQKHAVVLLNAEGEKRAREFGKKIGARIYENQDLFKPDSEVHSDGGNVSRRRLTMIHWIEFLGGLKIQFGEGMLNIKRI